MNSVPASVLISDFDGTITANDFYQLVVERLLTPDDLGPWAEYLAGRISHFEALRRIFATIRAPEERVLDVVRAMRPDPLLAKAVAALRAANWRVVVASAGCDGYIRRILAEAGVTLEVHANAGEYRNTEGGGMLIMRMPADSPFFCPETGIDKAAVVRFHLARAKVVAYAGDGFTDAPAALLVAPERRFARAALARTLREQGEPFRPFIVWSDVARALLNVTEL
jgi:2,3-diketo-5-methylthio-1-phosphopentane phosphatase